MFLLQAQDAAAHVDIDYQLIFSMLMTVLLALVGWGVHQIGARLDKLNGNVAKHQEDIHDHDVLLAKIETTLAAHMNESVKLTSQVGHMASAIQALSLNCVAIHGKQKHELQNLINKATE